MVVVRYSLAAVLCFLLACDHAEAGRRRTSRGSGDPASGVAGQLCRNGDRNAFRCMVCNVYFESRGEPYSGKIDVARTVLTRMNREGRGACRVIFRKYQFSWTLERPERLPTRRSTPGEYQALQDSVRAVRAARALGASGITHFYSSTMPRPPKWARSRKCRFVRQVGKHKMFTCRADIDQEMQESAIASAERGGLPEAWEYYAISGSLDRLVQAAKASAIPVNGGTDPDLETEAVDSGDGSDAAEYSGSDEEFWGDDGDVEESSLEPNLAPQGSAF